MDLSGEQMQAVEAAMAGKSIFLSGGAGVGKTKTLLAIIGQLRKRHPGSVAVIAPTGAAALLIGGQTIHSWAGIDLAGRPTLANPSIWLQSNLAVVIDEVSMVSAELFDLLDHLARKARNEPAKAFGGVQIILCGDFLQLQPVKAEYCFKSKAWQALAPARIELTFSFRQGNDANLAQILQKIRVGDCDEATVAFLCSNNKNAAVTDGIHATQLFTINEDVDKMNADELAKLPGTVRIYHAKDTGNFKQTSNIPLTLALKEGAQVVLLRNIDVLKGLVNGSRGVVVGFDGASLPIVRFASCNETRTLETVVWEQKGTNEDVFASRRQIPLALAYALTVHKAQGLSLDRVHVHLERCFAPGMAYVALSRCRSLAGLQVSGLRLQDIKAHPTALAFYNAAEPQKKRLKN